MRQKLRYIILLVFLVGFSIFSIRHFTAGALNAPSVDAMCPFGGFESAVTLVKTGDMVPRVMASSFILAGGVILVSLVFARGFCGWICPFGTVQELLGMIYKNKPGLPAWEKKPGCLDTLFCWR
jgi:polyferredoxin